MQTDALAKIVSEAILACQPIANSGIAVAVIKDRAPYYSDGFGFRDRSSSVKVDPATFFALGSATKAFTSMAVSLLVEENKIGLDDPIKQRFPDFAMKDPEATAKMTLTDILSHRTGLPRHDALWYLGPFSQPQLCYRLQYLQPNPAGGAGFRKSFEYNNMMYMLAGQLLESVAGERWEDFIKARILEPLNMPETNFSIEGFSTRTNYAKAYVKDAELALKDVANIGPAAEINSNVVEMTNWVLLHLNHGISSNGTAMISPAALEKMYMPITAAPGAGQGVSYGMGWFIGQIQSKRLVFHQGDTDGYSAYVSFMPDDGFAVIALSNQHGSPSNPQGQKFPDYVAERVYEFLLTGSATTGIRLPKGLLQTGSVESPGLAAPAAGSSPAAAPALGDYTGMFSDPGYGDMLISLSGNGLSISYYQQMWRLAPLAADKFFFKLHAFGMDFSVPVSFNRNAAGSVDSLSIPLERLIRPLQIQFVKR